MKQQSELAEEMRRIEEDIEKLDRMLSGDEDEGEGEKEKSEQPRRIDTSDTLTQEKDKIGKKKK